MTNKRCSKATAILAGLLVCFCANIAFADNSIDSARHDGRPPGSYIGVVGFSNTWQTIQGAEMQRPGEYWPSREIMDYSGGDLAAWDPDSRSSDRYWNLFQAELNRYPETTEIWWNIALLVPNLKDQRLGDAPLAERVFAELERRAQNRQIVVSPINFYPRGVDCLKSVDSQIMANLADYLVAGHREIIRGPNLYLDTAVELEPDNCHPNERGRADVGGQLNEFFSPSRRSRRR